MRTGQTLYKFIVIHACYRNDALDTLRVHVVCQDCIAYDLISKKEQRSLLQCFNLPHSFQGPHIHFMHVFFFVVFFVELKANSHYIVTMRRNMNSEIHCLIN